MEAILVLIALFAFSAQAADISGQMMGKSSLLEGKVEGNTITGDSIQLTVDFAGGGQTVECKLKRE